ncbi:hypothetical protein P154DRAFT_538977 [Amniculicola lignicola CBS 123094]|uniref:Uncharacterized protein n=1 Tax=Amniculicola lignicola CBS 123094 TaxID=1392246 RepID=A0A6A5W7T7_9PLEO|nr:hypothetical protein P154DRAFT_538977 [Amniculicola lignicola CBS 123094]
MYPYNTLAAMKSESDQGPDTPFITPTDLILAFFSGHGNDRTPQTQWFQSGSGFSPSTLPVLLSLVVLTLYCLLVMAHMLQSGVAGVTSTAWDSAAELVTLALRSRYPRHIGHTSVGIGTVGTSNEAVGIRNDLRDEVEIMFRRDVERDRGAKGTEVGFVEMNRAY